MLNKYKEITLENGTVVAIPFPVSVKLCTEKCCFFFCYKGTSFKLPVALVRVYIVDYTACAYTVHQTNIFKKLSVAVLFAKPSSAFPGQISVLSTEVQQ